MLTRAIKTYNNMKRTIYKTHTQTHSFFPLSFFPSSLFFLLFLPKPHCIPPLTMFIFSYLFLIFIFHCDVILPHCVFPHLPFFLGSWCLFFSFCLYRVFFPPFFSCFCCLFSPLSISILSSSSPHSPLGEFWVLFIGKDESF